MSYSSSPLGFAIAVLVAFVLAVVVAGIWWGYCRMRRVRTERCPECGYLQRGLKSSRCPECGNLARYASGAEVRTGDVVWHAECGECRLERLDGFADDQAAVLLTAMVGGPGRRLDALAQRRVVVGSEEWMTLMLVRRESEQSASGHRWPRGDVATEDVMYRYTTGEVVQMGDVVRWGDGRGVIERVIAPGSADAAVYAAPDGGVVIRTEGAEQVQEVAGEGTGWGDVAFVRRAGAEGGV